MPLSDLADRLPGSWLARLWLALGLLYLAGAVLHPLLLTHGAALLVLLALPQAGGQWRRLPPEVRAVLLGFVLYVAAALPSLFNTQDWHGAGWRFERYHPFLLILPVVLALHRQRRLAVPLLVGGVCLGGLALGAFAAWRQLATGWPRIGWVSALHPNMFGGVAFLFALLNGLAAALLARSRATRAVLLAGALAAGYAGFASGSRGALLAGLAGTAWSAGRLARRHPAGWRRLRGPLLAGAALLAAALLASAHWRGRLLQGALELHDFLRGEHQPDNTSERLMMWWAGLRIWAAHPLLGTGLGDTLRDFAALRADPGFDYFGRLYAIFHNIYIDALASTGLLGFGAMLAGVFVLPLRCFLRRLRRPDPVARWTGLAGSALLVYLAVLGLLHSWLYLRPVPLLLFVLALLLAGGAIPDNGGPDQPPSARRP